MLQPSLALAQTEPSGPPAVAQTGPAAVDPPARVGRIARLSGTVSFHPQDGEQWQAAARNYPLVLGDSLWTEPRGTAVVDLGGAHLSLASATEVAFDQIDPGSVSMTEAQGKVCVIVDPTPEPERYRLRTPRGTVTITQPGRYGIATGDTSAPTVVTVLAGAATVGEANAAVEVGANQGAVVTGSENFDTRVTPAQPDAFLLSTCAPRPPVRPLAVVPPPVTQSMVGASDLDAYGTWQASPQYGAVWYPQVEVGWVPYRHGHWAYVTPWGWTWIDDSPWGFAPFHYGRWAEFRGRWGWVPVAERVERPQFPIYAPALVSFLAPAAIVGGAVAWLPLGPREVYRPWYRASDNYVRDINIRQVQSVTQVTQNNTTVINDYGNRRGATMVPSAVLTESRPVVPAARPLPAAAFATAQPFVGRVPVEPTLATAGVTSALARRMDIATPAGFQSVPRPVAPGPAIRPATLGGPVPLPRAAVGVPTGMTPAINRPDLPPLVRPEARHALPGSAVAPAMAPGLPPSIARPAPAVTGGSAPPAGVARPDILSGTPRGPSGREPGGPAASPILGSVPPRSSGGLLQGSGPDPMARPPSRPAQPAFQPASVPRNPAPPPMTVAPRSAPQQFPRNPPPQAPRQDFARRPPEPIAVSRPAPAPEFRQIPRQAEPPRQPPMQRPNTPPPNARPAPHAQGGPPPGNRSGPPHEERRRPER